MELNITKLMYEQQHDPCQYVKDFNQQLGNRFKFAFITIFIIQILQYVLIDRYLKRYHKGEITDVDQFYILFTTFAIMQYVQGIFFLFMIFASAGLFNI